MFSSKWEILKRMKYCIHILPVYSIKYVLYIYRSQGLALLSVTSRCGAASAPWVAQYLGYYASYLPFLLMGSLTLVSAGFCFYLKETAGMTMAETLDDTRRENGMILYTLLVQIFTREPTQWAKSPKKTVGRSAFLLIRHSKSAFLLIRHSNYSTILSTIHSYRLLFQQYCPLGESL